jgi:hypothetical protein
LRREIAAAPLQVREKYEFWKSVVRNSGPEGLRTIKGFHDEALAATFAAIARRASTMRGACSTRSIATK